MYYGYVLWIYRKEAENFNNLPYTKMKMLLILLFFNPRDLLKTDRYLRGEALGKTL